MKPATVTAIAALLGSSPSHAKKVKVYVKNRLGYSNTFYVFKNNRGQTTVLREFLLGIYRKPWSVPYYFDPSSDPDRWVIR